MKKYVFSLTIIAFSMALLSYNKKRGGDVFEIYLNGKQVHQQFVHADKRAKNIQLACLNDNDKIEVFYSHCGYAGKKRVLTVRNGKNEMVKEFRFADHNDNRSRMAFFRKDIGKIKISKMNLYYASKELPSGKLLAAIQWTTGEALAKR